MNRVVLQQRPTPPELYRRLLAGRAGESVEDLLARILASWWAGQGALPAWLGLGEAAFRAMLARHFPGFSAIPLPVRPELDDSRLDERDDLLRLLQQNLTEGSEADHLMAGIVSSACLGSEHLWQDLGLWSRADLTRLMNDHFRPLAERNDRDMKWKKFLYKQLCEAEGIYTCRSPSCEVCSDYANCFGPEE